MTQKYRLEKGGYIKRDKKVSFKFNGKKYFGYQGDTLTHEIFTTLKANEKI